MFLHAGELQNIHVPVDIVQYKAIRTRTHPRVSGEITKNTMRTFLIPFQLHDIMVPTCSRFAKTRLSRFTNVGPRDKLKICDSYRPLDVRYEKTRPGNTIWLKKCIYTRMSYSLFFFLRGSGFSNQSFWTAFWDSVCLKRDTVIIIAIEKPDFRIESQNTNLLSSCRELECI